MSEQESVEVRLARVEERGLAKDEATKIASAVLEAWKVNANEWRQALNDQRINVPSRREHDALDDRVKDLEVAGGNQAGKAAAYASMAGAAGVLAAIIGHYWK
jgi:hypothetical protein